MLGVVIWANETREKAVIWCEDNAALAYLQGRGALIDRAMWPESGDLVEVDTRTCDNLRHVDRLALLTDHGRSELPQVLRNTVTPAEPQLTLVASIPIENRAPVGTGKPQLSSVGPLRRIFAAR